MHVRGDPRRSTGEQVTLRAVNLPALASAHADRGVLLLDPASKGLGHQAWLLTGEEANLFPTLRPLRGT